MLGREKESGGLSSYLGKTLLLHLLDQAEYPEMWEGEKA